MQYDLIIIGGGAGGVAAALAANGLKAKTLLINGGLPLGGTCINVGCVPSKKLIWSANQIYNAQYNKTPGISFEVSFNFQEIVQDELNLVKTLQKEKYADVIQSLEHVTFIEGNAAFINPFEIIVNNKDSCSAKKFIIAVGSTANILPIEGINEVGFITHVQAVSLKQLPKELTVIGAGPVGLEFAQMFSRLGSKVTILQNSDSIFPYGEPELTKQLTAILENENITIKTHVTTTKCYKKNNKKIMQYQIGGKDFEIAGDEILLAIGKTANTKNLGLDKAEVSINERKSIVVNKFLQSSQDHIFAVGDCVSLPKRLEPTAGQEGTYAAENALLNKQNTIDYTTVPFTIFTEPQYATVGLTEKEQIEIFGSCECRTISFTTVPKALIMNRTMGKVKMNIDSTSKQIMGIHILAPDAADIIAEAMMLVKNKNTIDDVLHSLPIFPSLSESIKLAALSFSRDISKLPCCI